jgi:uncharacterized peroxidase-related enzyme
MRRIKAIDPKKAEGKTGELLDAVQEKLGMVPNIMRTMANSPAVLKAYLGFSSALEEGSLPAKLRQQLALTVSEANGCAYCLAAHSAIGKTVGLSDDEILDSRRGISPTRKVEAALQFARKVVEKRGWVRDEDFNRLRSAGFNDGEISEIIANVSLKIFTNYFNHVAGTSIDFPEVRELKTPREGGS